MAELSGFTNAGDRLGLAWSGGRVDTVLAVWPRDNSPSPLARRANGQKLFGIAGLAPDLAIESVVNGDGAPTVRFAPDGHEARCGLDWPRTHAAPARRTAERRPWGAELARALPVHDWPASRACAAARRVWLADMRDLGFALFRNVPTAPGTAIEVARSFGYVRGTDCGVPFEIRFNNRSIDTFDLAPEVMPAFHRAYRRFAEAPRRPELEVAFKAGPGDLLILDNQRVLHGRGAVVDRLDGLFAAAAARHRLLCRPRRGGRRYAPRLGWRPALGAVLPAGGDRIDPASRRRKALLPRGRTGLPREALRRLGPLRGGVTWAGEARAFAGRRHGEDVIRIRRWDGEGKDPEVRAPGFARYRPLLQRLVAGYAP